MIIKNLTIKGFRGFTDSRKIEFAIPDGETAGSGLTILVGPNNSGKSSIIEALHILSLNSDTMPRSMRNEKVPGVMIKCVDGNDNTYCIRSTESRGAFIEKVFNGIVQSNFSEKIQPFILSSKRGFTSTFSSNYRVNRDNYHGNIGNNEYRSSNVTNSNFGARLLNVMKSKNVFDNYLKQIIYPAPNWTIDAIDSNNMYLEFSFNNTKHDSIGAGDGYINIFNIIDAIYDSVEQNLIIIDEPEISLHPDLQKKLFKLLKEQSKNKQIIISTHSPYFIDWDILSKKGKIIRLEKNVDNIDFYELSDDSIKNVNSFLKNYYNPHILGLDANEVFFLNDNIILVEGQDDIVCYKKIFEKYNFNPFASFFGWGVGGADNMEKIILMLKELGYSKIFCILDGDKKDNVTELTSIYPEFCFHAIPTNDVRTKVDKVLNPIIREVSSYEFDEEFKNKILDLLNSKAKNVYGLVNKYDPFVIDDKYDKDIKELISKIEEYFKNDIKNDNDEISDSKEDIINIKKSKMSSNNSSYELIKANDLFADYMSSRKFDFFEYIKNRYKNLNFDGAGCTSGGDLKKVGKNRYLVEATCGASISESQSVEINLKFLINIKTKKVTLNKSKVIKNTLPLNFFERLIDNLRWR